MDQPKATTPEQISATRRNNLRLFLLYRDIITLATRAGLEKGAENARLYPNKTWDGVCDSLHAGLGTEHAFLHLLMADYPLPELITEIHAAVIAKDMAKASELLTKIPTVSVFTEEEPSREQQNVH